eukprot:scaffold462_cov195-Pinguiococcus_pyrenoidosus.AAC.43
MASRSIRAPRASSTDTISGVGQNAKVKNHGNESTNVVTSGTKNAKAQVAGLPTTRMMRVSGALPRGSVNHKQLAYRPSVSVPTPRKTPSPKISAMANGSVLYTSSTTKRSQRLKTQKNTVHPAKLLHHCLQPFAKRQTGKTRKARQKRPTGPLTPDEEALRQSIVGSPRVLQEWDAVDEDAVQNGGSHPLQNLAHVHVHVLAAHHVELGVCERVVRRHVLLEDAHRDDRQRREEVVATVQPLVEDRRSRVAAGQVEEEQRHHQHEVFVETVQNHHRHAPIVPSPVHQQQALQVAELRDGEVAGVHSLLTFQAGDAHAHLRLLNHGHVVRSVADRQGHRRGRHVALDHLDKQRLLLRRRAARQDTAALGRDVEKHLRQVLVDHHKFQCCSLHDKYHLPAVAHHVADLRALQALLLHLVNGSLRLYASHLLQQVGDLLLLPRLILSAPPLRRLSRLSEAAVQHHHVHVRLDDAAGPADLERRAGFVAGEHPELNASGQERFDGVWHAILQLVFYRGGAKEDELLLDLVRHVQQPLLSFRHRGGGVVILLQPRVRLRLRHVAVAQDQRAQPLVGEEIQVLHERLGGGALLLRRHFGHGRVRAFDQKPNLAGGIPDEHRHSLPRGIEGVRRELFVEDLLAFISLGPLDFGVVVGLAWTPQVESVRVPVLQRVAQILRGRDQRAFVGRLGLIHQLSVLPLHHDGVAQRQDVHEHLVIDELSVDGAALERHDVLRQRAGLVGEDVLDLPQVGHGGGARLGWHVDGLVVQLEVRLDVHHHEARDDLDGDIQRDGENVVVQHEEGQEGRQEAVAVALPADVGVLRIEGAVAEDRAGLAVDEEAEVVGAIDVLLFPDDVRDGRHDAKDDVREQHHVDGAVDELVHLGQLLRRLGGVLGELGLVAGVHHCADDSLGVAHDGASEQHVLRRDTPRIGVPLQQAPVEGMNRCLLPSSDRVALQRERSRGHLRRHGEACGGGAALEIGLAVDGLGLAVADAALLGRVQDDHVRGHFLAIAEFQQHADLHVLPAHGGAAAVQRHVLCHLVVHQSIVLVPKPVSIACHHDRHGL